MAKARGGETHSGKGGKDCPLCYSGWYSTELHQDHIMGQIAGTEAVFHAVRYVLNHNDSGAILLVDSTNAFTH